MLLSGGIGGGCVLRQTPQGALADLDDGRDVGREQQRHLRVDERPAVASSRDEGLDPRGVGSQPGDRDVLERRDDGLDVVPVEIDAYMSGLELLQLWQHGDVVRLDRSARDELLLLGRGARAGSEQHYQRSEHELHRDEEAESLHMPRWKEDEGAARRD